MRASNIKHGVIHAPIVLAGVEVLPISRGNASYGCLEYSFLNRYLSREFSDFCGKWWICEIEALFRDTSHPIRAKKVFRLTRKDSYTCSIIRNLVNSFILLYCGAYGYFSGCLFSLLSAPPVKKLYYIYGGSLFLSSYLFATHR